MPKAIKKCGTYINYHLLKKHQKIPFCVIKCHCITKQFICLNEIKTCRNMGVTFYMEQKRIYFLFIQWAMRNKCIPLLQQINFLNLKSKPTAYHIILRPFQVAAGRRYIQVLHYIYFAKIYFVFYVLIFLKKY